jgi:hypothetical protein
VSIHVGAVSFTAGDPRLRRSPSPTLPPTRPSTNIEP